MNLKDEVKRREMFEKGTPCIYFDGKKDISGEVVTAKTGVQAIAPYFEDGRAGTQDTVVIPRTWFNVRKFNNHLKKYTKTHKSSKAMKNHIEKIIKRNGAYGISEKKLYYWF